MMQLGPGEKLEQGKEISHRGLKIVFALLCTI